MLVWVDTGKFGKWGSRDCKWSPISVSSLTLENFFIFFNGNYGLDFHSFSTVLLLPVIKKATVNDLIIYDKSAMIREYSV